MSLDAGLWSFFLLFVAGFAVSEPWRFAGVLLSKNVSVDSEFLKWVRSVSTALIAGLVTRLVIFPIGALADTPFWLRLCCFLLGIVAYFVFRKKMYAGVLTGAGALVIALYVN